MTEIAGDQYYRAGVLLEVGRSHAAHRRTREALAAWNRAAAMLRGVARQMPLDAGHTTGTVSPPAAPFRLPAIEAKSESFSATCEGTVHSST